MNTINNIQGIYADFHLGWGCAIAILCFALYMAYAIKVKKKKPYIGALIFAVYMVLLLGGTLLNRTVGDEYRMEWIPFWSYWDTFVMHDDTLWRQMLYNVAVFIPWGFLFPMLFQQMQKLRKNVLGAAVMSLGIEFIQLLLKLGLFEFDDIFHNTLGALIGYVLWRVFRKIQIMHLDF